MKHLLIIVLACFLITACVPQGPRTQNTSGPTTQPSSAGNDVFDKTPYPALQASIPADADIAQWVKTIDLIPKPENIPRVLPTNNTVYYQVDKTIDGKKRTVSVVFGDIIKEDDAIVNAANGGLEGGGGIDGFIHDKAKVNGKDLMKDEAIAYKKLHGISSLPTGSAMVTKPYGLPSSINMVVFTVGPNPGGNPPTEQQKLELYSAVYSSLLKASEYGAKSISIPAISGGIFDFDLTIASELYFKAVFQFFADHPDTSIEHVRFTNFDNDDSQGKPTVQRVAEAFVKLFP
jgi:O-acetyl-ADP-ribose deacetylase (regulator of RNase III)